MDDAFVRRGSPPWARGMKALHQIETEPDYGALVDRRFVRQARGE